MGSFFSPGDHGLNSAPRSQRTYAPPLSAIFPQNLTRLTNRRALNTSVKDQLILFSAVNFDSP